MRNDMLDAPAGFFQALGLGRSLTRCDRNSAMFYNAIFPNFQPAADGLR